MICRNCKTYYVRAPCPSCGDDPSKGKQKEESVKLSPSQIRTREMESGGQVLLQEKEERLVKPSERFKQERKEETTLRSMQRTEQSEDHERLVKPSERLRQRDEEDEDLPSFRKFKAADTVKAATITPKPPVQKDEEIPSFKRFDTEKKETADLNEISKAMGNKEQQTKLKNDKEYRSKVKETLEEVVGLLERLIEDD